MHDRFCENERFFVGQHWLTKIMEMIFILIPISCSKTPSRIGKINCAIELFGADFGNYLSQPAEI